MIRFLLLTLLVLLLAGYLLGRSLRRLPPAQRARRLRRWMWLGGGVALVVLAVTGRLHWLFGLFGALIPLAQQLWNLWRYARRLRRSKRPDPKLSTIETRWLRMQLDHASGRLDGVVLQGPYQGRRLAELDRAALLDLLHRCRVEDEDGARLLEAYLDRRFGPEWRHGFHSSADSGHNGEAMTVEEAREILGVGPDASAEEIRKAHRRLMQKYHPDRGGSTQLAARINRAKEVLLGRQRG